MFKTTKGCDARDVSGELPSDTVPEDVDLEDVAQIALAAVKDLKMKSLTTNVLWRDWLSLSGRTHTFCGVDEVFENWHKSSFLKRLSDIALEGQMVLKPCTGSSWVSVDLSFETIEDSGLYGYHTAKVGLIPAEGGWKIWLIATILERFEGHDHPDEPQMAVGNTQPVKPDGLDYSVVIIGAGQCGISLAARLKALNIPAVVIERGHTVGQSWISKYDTVRQHTPREYNNLPFNRTWNEEDDRYLFAKDVVKGYNKYVKDYDIEVLTSTEAISATRDDTAQTWTIEVQSANPSPDQVITQKITSRHLAMATGAGFGKTKPPTYPSSELFKGTLLHHHSFRNASKFPAGHRTIIIGSGVTAHDIAQDCLDHNLQVTMIQRSNTVVVPEPWLRPNFELHMNRNIPMTVTDRIFESSPTKIGLEIFRRQCEIFAKEPKWQEFFAGLEKAGFRVDRESGLLDQMHTRYGGYYIDIGTSKHIINGDIKIKSSVGIKQLTADGILFEDGVELPADLIITATGYDHEYRKQIAQVVGDDMAGQLPEFWGLNKNGDLRGVMEEGRPGLWMLGGDTAKARWTSRFIALKMLVDLLGVDRVVK